MAKKNTKSAKRQSGVQGEAIVTEQTKTRVYPRKRVAVRTEPATLSEALGETVIARPTTVRRVVKSRRAA
jgi:hypothetical protein